MIDPHRIADAQSLLARHFGPTPIARAASLSSPARDIFLKIETGLPTGSFKVRGAPYALSVAMRAGLDAGSSTSPAQRPHASFAADDLRTGPRRVVCASTGNHGAAVAWAAQLLNVPATIFLPVNSNPV